MSVAFDAVSTASGSSWTHTPVGTPTGVAVLLQVYAVTSGTQDPGLAVTYGGVPMTLAVTANASNSTQTAIFGLSNPPPGPQTVVVTATSLSALLATAITVTGGVTSGSPFSATQVNSGGAVTPGTVTLTRGTIGELVVDICSTTNTNTLTAAGGQTQRSNQSVGFAAAAVSTKPSITPVTFSWTIGGTLNSFQDMAASFKVPGVTVDAYSSGNGGINSRFLSSSLAPGGITGPNFCTVASDATLLLVWSVIQDQPANYGTMTVTWDSGGTNQVMTLVGQVINFDTFNCFALVNPTPGTKTLLIRATTETSQNIQTVGQSLKGTVTTSAAAAVEGLAFAFDWGSGSNPVTVNSAVAIPVGDLAFSFYVGQNNFPSIPTDSGILVDAEFGVLAEEEYSGTGSVVTASNTMSSSGFWQAGIIGVKAAGGAITGTMAVTESPDVFAGAGTSTITGTMVVTEAADAFAASGTVGFPAITGTMAVTEAPDIFAGSAFGTITGTMVVTETPDHFSASGSTFSVITGTMAVTDTPDRFASPAAAPLQTLSLYGRRSGMVLQGSSS